MPKLDENFKSYLSGLENKYGWQTAGTLPTLSKIESDNNPNATAKGSTAQGMFQIVKGTREMLGLKNAFDPYEAADAAMRYLVQLKKMFNGDEQKAVLAYHAGPGNVLKHGLDTSQMPKAVVRDYLNKFNKNLGSSGYSSGESTFNAPMDSIASGVDSYKQDADYKSGYNLTVPATLDDNTNVSDTQTPDNFKQDADYKAGYNLTVPATLDDGTAQQASTTNAQVPGSNIQQPAQPGNIQNNANQQPTTTNTFNTSLNGNGLTGQPTSQPANAQQTPASNGQLNTQLPASTATNPQEEQRKNETYDPMGIPGNPPQTTDNRLFNQFASLPDDQQLNFYQSLDQGSKNLLLGAIKKNIGDNPEVDHPGMFRNFIQGTLNRGNEIGRSITQAAMRGISSGANAIGLEGLGQSAENVANQASRDQLRYEAAQQLNEAANPSITRSVGEMATDMGAMGLIPFGAAGATGGMVAKLGKYALAGGGYNALTAPTHAFNNGDYLVEKIKDATTGAIFGALGGTTGDAASKYISKKFGDFIPMQSKALKAWADRNGINVSAFAFPEVRQDLLNFLTANGRDKKISDLITKNAEEIAKANKNFGNQFGDYFADSAGNTTTANAFVKDNFPQVYKTLERFDPNNPSKDEYGKTINNLFNKLADPKKPEEVFSSLAQLDFLNRRIVSSDLYKKAEPPLSKFKFSGDDVKSELMKSLDFKYSNGNSETRNTINKILSEIPDGESVSALKIANIQKLLGKTADELDGKTTQNLYIDANKALDKYLQEQALRNDYFKPVLEKYKDAKMYNKNAIQEVQADDLSKEIFNNDFTNFKKLTNSSNPRQLENIWGNMTTPAQKSLQNYLVTSMTAKATNGDVLNPAMFAKQIDKLMESEIGNIVLKAHKDDLVNMANLSRNINTSYIKAVQNGSLSADGWRKKLGERASFLYALGALGGAGATQALSGGPVMATAVAATILLPHLLRENATKILSSKDLRNELFQVSNTKGGEISGEMLSNFIRSLGNSGTSNLTSPNRANPNDNSNMQNLIMERNRSNQIDANGNFINNTNNEQAVNSVSSLEELRRSRGIK